MDNQEPDILPKKRKNRWLVWLIASPFLLFALLCVLLYLPPVQNFVVDKVATVASDATGLNISVGRITLSFPLDLVVKDVQAVNPEKGDTLLSLKRLEVSVQMLPLLKKEIEIDGIGIEDADVHTGDFIDGMGIDGHLGELFLESHGVVFDPEKAVVNEFSIKNTDLEICLTDTTETPDTTTTDTLYWKIDLRKIALENVSVGLKMPHDSLDMRVALASSTLKNGYIDLHESSYSVRSFDIQEGVFVMDSTLNLQSIDLQVDSVYYCDRDIRATVSRFDLAEKNTGLEVLSTYAKVVADKHQIRIPALDMRTVSSTLKADASLDWDLLEMKPSSAVSATLKADIGKRDVALMTGTLLDSTFIKHYPDAPLQLRADMEGDLNRLQLHTLSATLLDALDVRSHGELKYLTDSLRRGGELTLSAIAEDLSFLPAMTGGVAIPTCTSLQGKALVEGPQIVAGMTLALPDTLTQQTDTVMTLGARYHLSNEA